MPKVSRRGFLASCVGVSAAYAATSLPGATWHNLMMAAKERPIADGTGILVLITLYGGNDGLNTVIPFSNSAYQDARPDLAYTSDEVLTLDTEYGLNPGMPGMADMFHEGTLAIVRGVGYPEPDRSHFRSLDIWQTASLDNSDHTGWIGRWLDTTGEDPLHALHMGPVVPPLAVGQRTIGAIFSPAAKPPVASSDLIVALSRHHPEDSAAMRMVCDSFRDAGHVNRGLEPVFGKDSHLSDTADPADNDLSNQLATVAACILAEVPTRVYSVELSGFDTHADERGTQQELLQKLDSAVTGFMKQISGTKHAKDVVVMAYSEFGRRVAANASDGTDHGTAGPVFIFGDRVRGGLYGEDPSLTELVDDDLKVTTDFRDVYHEVLVSGLGSDSEPILGPKRREVGFLPT